MMELGLRSHPCYGFREVPQLDRMEVLRPTKSDKALQNPATRPMQTIKAPTV